MNKDDYAPGTQAERRMKRGDLRYLFFAPRRYGTDDGSWPLMIFLHGAGERGTEIARVKAHGPPRLVERDADFPFLVAAPQCGPRSYWEPRQIIALLDEVIEAEAVDVLRVYLTGISMGGYGTWQTAIEHPDRFAAIVPICGGGDPRKARRIAHLPVWAFHGERDDIVPVSETIKMVEALRAVGGNVRVTIYPHLGHDSWTETYDDPKLYKWLLGQRNAFPIG